MPATQYWEIVLENAVHAEKPTICSAGQDKDNKVLDSFPPPTAISNRHRSFFLRNERHEPQAAGCCSLRGGECIGDLVISMIRNPSWSYNRRITVVGRVGTQSAMELVN